MNSYKIIVIGSQLSGKTTLAKYLHSNTELNILEMEEELMRLNNNVWPDNKLKDTVLIPQICKEIIDRDSLVFLTSQFDIDLLSQAKVNGFKVIELQIDKQSILERNAIRMKDEGYDDASVWVDGQLEFIQKLEQLNLFDVVIDAKKPVSEIATEIQNNL